MRRCATCKVVLPDGDTSGKSMPRYKRCRECNARNEWDRVRFEQERSDAEVYAADQISAEAFEAELERRR